MEYIIFWAISPCIIKRLTNEKNQLEIYDFIPPKCQNGKNVIINVILMGKNGRTGENSFL